MELQALTSSINQLVVGEQTQQEQHDLVKRVEPEVAAPDSCDQCCSAGSDGCVGCPPHSAAKRQFSLVDTRAIGRPKLFMGAGWMEWRYKMMFFLSTPPHLTPMGPVQRLWMRSRRSSTPRSPNSCCCMLLCAVVCCCVLLCVVACCCVLLCAGVCGLLLGVQHTSRPFIVHVESVCPDAHHLLAFGSSELP